MKEVLEVLEGKFSIVDEYAQEKGTDDVQEAVSYTHLVKNQYNMQNIHIIKYKSEIHE